jgi:hypothetical protein
MKLRVQPGKETRIRQGAMEITFPASAGLGYVEWSEEAPSEIESSEIESAIQNAAETLTAAPPPLTHVQAHPVVVWPPGGGNAYASTIAAPAPAGTWNGWWKMVPSMSGEPGLRESQPGDPFREAIAEARREHREARKAAFYRRVLMAIFPFSVWRGILPLAEEAAEAGDPIGMASMVIFGVSMAWIFVGAVEDEWTAAIARREEAKPAPMRARWQRMSFWREPHAERFDRAEG